MKFTLGTAVALLALPMAVAAVVIPETADMPGPAKVNITQLELDARSPQNCGLRMQWVENWGGGDWRRMHVKAWVDQGQFAYNTFDMVTRYCDFFYGMYICHLLN